MFTIRIKLIISFAILTLFIVGLATLSINKIKESSAAFNDYDDMVDYSVLVNRVQTNMLMVRLSFKGFLLDPSQEEVNTFNHYYKITSEYINQARIEQSNIGIKDSDPLQIKKLDQISSYLVTYNRDFQTIQESFTKRNYLVNEVINIQGPIIQRSITDIMRFHKDYDELMVSYLAAETLRTALLARLYAAKFIKTHSEDDMQRVLYEFSHLDEQLITLQQRIINPIKLSRIAEANNSIEIYIKAIDELYEIIKQRNALVDYSLDVIGVNIANISEEMSLSIISNQHDLDQKVEELNLSIISLMTIVAIIVSILAAMLAFFIPRSISRGLLSIKNSLVNIRKTGDFSMRADEQRQDEIGAMGRSVNQLLSQLQSAISESNQVVENISKGVFSKKITTEFKGDLLTLKDGINNSAKSIQETMAILSETMKSLSRGDFSFRTINTGIEGDFANLLDETKTTMVTMGEVVTDINTVMDNVSQGKFDKQVTVAANGEMNSLKDNINQSLSGLNSAINEVVMVANKMGEGDLSLVVNGNYHGSLNGLKNAINSTVDRLSKVVNQVRETSHNVKINSVEVSKGSQEIAECTSEQVSSLEETAVSMEQMSVAVNMNSDNASQANQLATESLRRATEGVKIVANVEQAMSGINQSNNKISEIISLIDGIAFQTNLLALNAAVEAARAGEHGRGFAVVAGEVRNLAQRSADAAKDIKSLIADSTSRITQGNELVKSSGESLDSIKDSIKEVSGIVNQIAKATKEQATGIEQVNMNIVHLDSVTKQNAIQVEHTASAGKELNSQADELSEVVAFFKTKKATQLLS